MNILHLISGDLSSGGAARGAYWLHLGLRKLGVNSKVLTNSQDVMGDISVTSILKGKISKLEKMITGQLDSLPLMLYPNRKQNDIFSTGLVGYNFIKTPEYQQADIIHLHWINNGFVNIKDLSKIDKPIVWTIRDMWPFTGGCHISYDCDRYKNGCGNCRHLNSKSSFDLSKIIYSRKIKYYPKTMEVVGISDWISEEAKKSNIFREISVKTIANSIDTSVFYPTDKSLARKALGIEKGKRIILTGAGNLRDPYKGFDKYLEAVSILDRKKYLLCFFGNLDKTVIEGLGFECKTYGAIRDSEFLRLVYSSSDVFVASSVMEPFGKTLVEAMSCGTPVACFDATGPKDIVTHLIDGYKAKPFDSVDLADGIEWIINNHNYDKLCENAIKNASSKFDNVVIAERYIDLYTRMLSSSRNASCS